MNNRRANPHGSWLTLAIVLGSLSLSSMGCAVSKAAKIPTKKDTSVLVKGTPREYVIAELGEPTVTSERNGQKVDIFAFKKGISRPARFFRVLFHTAADVFTLGLWEAIGTPIEAATADKKSKIEVTYDNDDRMLSYKTL